ncbi:MAG: uroporphyrinogen-III synthase [Nevskia sp.]|nr:uroporphyrinogen-III synthase [Nevskia sp.]
MTAAPLRGLRVLVTRPAQQAAALCRLIEQAGGEALPLPLLAIVPAADPAAAAQRLAGADAFDLCIFTSVNAVRHGLGLHAGPWPPLLAAAGAATAEALRDAGFAGVLAPVRGDGGEGLLAAPELQAAAGRRVLIVTGENTLAGLAEGLRARGAAVATVAVYRRVPEPADPAQVAQQVGLAQAAVVTSGESLERLCAVVPADSRERLLELQLAVPSRRVAALARQLGFQRPPLVPARVADAEFVALLQDWRAGQ